MFNASGQTIDVEGLLSIARGWGPPLANPVKDSMESKLRPDSRNLLAVIFGSRKVVSPAAMHGVATRLERLLVTHCGASGAETSVVPAE